MRIYMGVPTSETHSKRWVWSGRQARELAHKLVELLPLPLRVTNLARRASKGTMWLKLAQKTTRGLRSKRWIQRKDPRGWSETQTRKGVATKNQDLFINNTRCFHLRKITPLCTANSKIWQTILSRCPWGWVTSNLSSKSRVFWTNLSTRPPICTWILTTQPLNSRIASIRVALENNKPQIRDNLSLPAQPSTKTSCSKTTSKWTKCWSVIACSSLSNRETNNKTTPPQIRMWLIRSSTSRTATMCPKPTQ